jgi:hypothetical protein
MLKQSTHLVFVLLSIFAIAKFCATSEAADSGSKVVEGAGCVESGIEASCRVLHDQKTGRNFNLFFGANAPSVDTAIRFEGTTNDNPNVCMEGVPVDVTKWNPIRLHCPQKTTPSNAAVSPTATNHMCGAWTAWYNVQPGSPKELHVAGMCTFPTSGYAVVLTKRIPPGTNPKRYLLELKITSPSGDVSQIVRHVPVHYQEQTEIQHEFVEIYPYHLAIPVKTIE